MGRRLAVITLTIPPVLAIAMDAYPKAGEPLFLLFVFPLVWYVAALYLWAALPIRALFRQRMALVGLCAALYVSVILTHWPLRLSFTLAKPRLEAIVREAPSSNPESLCSIEKHAGLFTIRRMFAKRSDSVHKQGEIIIEFIGLWENEEDPDSNSSFQGFVYSPGNRYPGNLWTDIDLGNGWRYVVED